MIKVDLDYIYTISDSDRDFIKEMLTTFVKITPESIDNINKALETKNWKEMARVAHKIKPSILLLGIDEFSNLVREIEQIPKHEIDVNSISVKVSLLNQYSLEALTDINDKRQLLVSPAHCIVFEVINFDIHYPTHIRQERKRKDISRV